MINGTYANGGRPTDKVRNLKRFAKQWQEFEDEESLGFGEDDARYVAETLHMEGPGLGRYHAWADALEV